MKRERIYLYDTTLRDGQQTQGVNFTVDDKIRISNALDELGIDYVEGGWPGANPTDSDFFNTNPQLKATFTAFGMTKRSGKSAENDEVLSAVLNANLWQEAGRCARTIAALTGCDGPRTAETRTATERETFP
jgi:2-isopropylmalate synthase